MSFEASALLRLTMTLVRELVQACVGTLAPAPPLLRDRIHPALRASSLPAIEVDLRCQYQAHRALEVPT